MKKIGLIGASGFIGRSILDYDFKTSFSFTAFTRKKKFELPKNVQLINSELSNLNTKIFNDLDCLILSFSDTTPFSNKLDYEFELNKNVIPHINLLNKLSNTNLKHIIFISSGGEIYGRSSVKKIDEMCQTNPITPYGFGKLCIENILKAKWIGFGRKYTILRPSNPIGKYQYRKNIVRGLIATSYSNIYNGQDIKVYGDGTTIRDYFGIDDFCQLIEKVIISNEKKNEIINVSSGKGSSINKVLQYIFEIYGKQTKIDYIKEYSPPIPYNVLCNNYAKEKYNWKPTTNLYEVIKNFNTQFIKDFNNQ